MGFQNVSNDPYKQNITKQKGVPEKNIIKQIPIMVQDPPEDGLGGEYVLPENGRCLGPFHPRNGWSWTLRESIVCHCLPMFTTLGREMFGGHHPNGPNREQEQIRIPALGIQSYLLRR